MTTLFLFLAATLRILAIGNSFSQDAVEQNLYEICAAAGQQVIIGNMYIPGCSIDKHVRCMENDSPSYDYRKIGLDGVKVETGNYRLSQAIEDEPWDVVSVQQSSGYSGQYGSYAKLSVLVSWIREKAPQAKIVFHRTWAYSPESTHKHYAFYDNDQLTMWNAIVDASERACRDCGIETIIPAGDAIQAARSTSLGPDLTRDGYHLDLTIGRYIAAAAWFEALTGKSILRNRYRPEGISKQDLKTARKAVHSVRPASRLRPL